MFSKAFAQARLTSPHYILSSTRRKQSGEYVIGMPVGELYRVFDKIGIVDAETKQSAENLAAMLRIAQRTVIFTGAGISTESGIPDYRSPGGIWTKMMPIN